MNDDECVHLLMPGTCAYCSGSWRREQDALARESAMIGARMAARAGMATGTRTVRGWTASN